MTDKLPPALRACADAPHETPADVEDYEQPQRTLDIIARMLGWMNTPPRRVFEQDINALKSRACADALAPPEPVDWDASYHQRLDTLSAALAPLTGKGEVMELPDIEVVAAKVHEAWMETKRQQGITSRPAADGTEQMVPYAELPDALQELDRATVRAVYAAIEASAK